MSPDTVRDNLKYFTKHLPDVLEYRFDRQKLKDDFGRVVIGADNKPVFRSTSYITLKPLIEFPQEIIADAPRQQGGSRKCKVCGSDDLEVVKRTRCRHCNNIEWDWPADSDMGPEPPTQDLLYSNPDVPHLEAAPIASQEDTASVSEIESSTVPVEIEPLKNASESIIEPVEQNSTAIEILVTVLSHYGVKHLDYMTCHCGCKLFHMSLGDWCCARCEPGNFWPDNYIKAIKAVYPGKVVSS